VSDKQSGAQAILEQMGGISGLIYSSLPILVFVPVSSLFSLIPAIISALAVAAAILVWRLVRKESVQPAISGFMGVGICALIAYLVGESKGYFLYGIWMSLFWAVVFLVSVLIRRSIVGYIWRWVNGHDRGWRNVRRAVLVFDIATITWVLVFAARFVVQRHLYNLDETGWLAAARILMPKSVVRLSAGRARMSESDQALCFMAGANSIFSSDDRKMLTRAVPCSDYEADQQMLDVLGLKMREPFKDGHPIDRVPQTSNA